VPFCSGMPSRTQSATRSTTQNFAADHILPWFAFTVKLATWSRRPSTRAISKSG